MVHGTIIILERILTINIMFMSYIISTLRPRSDMYVVTQPQLQSKYGPNHCTVISVHATMSSAKEHCTSVQCIQGPVPYYPSRYPGPGPRSMGHKMWSPRPRYVL